MALPDADTSRVKSSCSLKFTLDLDDWRRKKEYQNRFAKKKREKISKEGFERFNKKGYWKKHTDRSVISWRQLLLL